MISAAPEFVAIYNSENEDITGQVVGPYTAGSEAAFSCKSGGGKPAPSVSWTFGDEVLEGETEVSEDTQTGSMTVTNNLVVTLEVEQVGERLTCRYNKSEDNIQSLTTFFLELNMRFLKTPWQLISNWM